MKFYIAGEQSPAFLFVKNFRIRNGNIKMSDYTSREAAFEQASERLQNQEVQERADIYLGGDWPPGFEGTDSPKAVYAPYLATGSETETEFVLDAKKGGFEPVVATYLRTEFVTANGAIVDCYRPPLKLPNGQQQRKWIVPESDRIGELGQANTFYEGVNILAFWSGVRTFASNNAGINQLPETVDFSEWYKRQAIRFGWNEVERSKSGYYYNALMGLYASGRAVLYDTPPTEFYNRIMKPAVQLAEIAIGAKPILTNILQGKKRDWVDLAALNSEQVLSLQEIGKINA